jgi:hypothetical protein
MSRNALALQGEFPRRSVNFAGWCVVIGMLPMFSNSTKGQGLGKLIFIQVVGIIFYEVGIGLAIRLALDIRGLGVDDELLAHGGTT